MGTISKIAAAVAVAAIGVAATATTASAITITGGPAVSATWDNQPTFTLGGSYTMACDGGFAGAVTSSTVMSIEPSFTNCDFSGAPVDFSTTGELELTITGGSGSFYNYSVTVPSGTSMTFEAPLYGCGLTVSGPQTLATGVGGSWFSANVLMSRDAVMLEASASGIEYTPNDYCPFSGSRGSDGTFSSSGSGTIAGISITP